MQNLFYLSDTAQIRALQKPCEFSPRLYSILFVAVLLARIRKNAILLPSIVHSVLILRLKIFLNMRNNFLFLNFQKNGKTQIHQGLFLFYYNYIFFKKNIHRTNAHSFKLFCKSNKLFYKSSIFLIRLDDMKINFNMLFIKCNLINWNIFKNICMFCKIIFIIPYWFSRTKSSSRV